jgi:hypothetical protein
MPGGKVLYGYQSPKPNNDMGDPYGLYNLGVEGDASMRDRIMKGYEDVLKRNDPNSGLYQNRTYTPTMANYGVSPYFSQAYGTNANLVSTGGLTANEQADMRERGISPIRSVYANAQREADRGVNLAGGYSPNAGAIRAKMAREMSDKVSQQVTNVNADIAQRVQQGRLAGAGTIASMGTNENDIRNKFSLENAQAANQAGQFNSQVYNLGANRDLEALAGMRSLYGTTPAQAQLFGSQAMQGTQLQHQIATDNSRTGLQAIGAGIAPRQTFASPRASYGVQSPTQARSVAPPILMPGMTRPFPTYA